MKLKLDDQVLVITGKDKGKKGKIIKLYSKQNKIVVEKINIKTKHVKKTKERAGEKIQFEGPINASNAMVMCPSCSKPSRVGYKITDNKKQRICKRCKAVLDKKVGKK